MKAQPKGAAPVSREVVEVVKRKMAAPSRPPPEGMTLNFKAPKNVSSSSSKRESTSNRQYDEYDNPYEEGDDFSNEYAEEDYYYSEDSGNHREHRYDYDDGENLPYQDEQTSRSIDLQNRGTVGNRSTDANTYAQSKQYSAGGMTSNSLNTIADVKDNKQKVPVDSKLSSTGSSSSQLVSSSGNNAVVSIVSIEVPPGPPSFVVSQYLQAARTSAQIFNYQPVLRATYRELKQYATSPCVPGVTTRCYIERNRSGTKRLAPYYSVCADLDDGTGRELMVCRKVMQSRTPHYIFSLKAEDLWRKREQRSRLYLGKLRAISSTCYVLYDNGICEAPEEPDSFYESRERDDNDVSSQERDTALARKTNRESKSGSSSGGVEDVSLYRSELMVLNFNTKARPAPAGIRGTEVCIQNNFLNTSGGSANTNNKSTGCYSILSPFNKIRTEGKQNSMYTKSCFILHEKTSRYDPLSACLVDFKGRANMASIKNVQFIVSDPSLDTANLSSETLLKIDSEKDFVVQLGKTTEDCFNMDYRHPLSLLQAFAICIARFDAKLTW